MIRNFTGLNGDTAFAMDDVPVGRVNGESYGYKKRLVVTVSVRMEYQARLPEYETVEHALVKKPLDYSITTAVWQPRLGDMTAGGATVEPLRDLVFENDFTPEEVDWLIESAAWHLSGMTAGCVHQDPKAELDSPPCPVTGYRWGSAWLVRVLPDGFFDNVKRIFADKEKLER